MEKISKTDRGKLKKMCDAIESRKKVNSINNQRSRAFNFLKISTMFFFLLSQLSQLIVFIIVQPMLHCFIKNS